MGFTSFAAALQVCLTAAENSPEQEAALEYCLQNAPPDLRLLLAQRLAERSGLAEHGDSCGCGCMGEAE